MAADPRELLGTIQVVDIRSRDVTDEGVPVLQLSVSDRPGTSQTTPRTIKLSDLLKSLQQQRNAIVERQNVVDVTEGMVIQEVQEEVVVNPEMVEEEQVVQEMGHHVVEGLEGQVIQIGDIQTDEGQVIQTTPEGHFIHEGRRHIIERQIVDGEEKMFIVEDMSQVVQEVVVHEETVTYVDENGQFLGTSKDFLQAPSQEYDVVSESSVSTSSMKIHGHICGACGREFRTAFSLASHRKIEHGEVILPGGGKIYKKKENSVIKQKKRKNLNKLMSKSIVTGMGVRLEDTKKTSNVSGTRVRASGTGSGIDDEITWQCADCDQTFETAEAFAVHRETCEKKGDDDDETEKASVVDTNEDDEEKSESDEKKGKLIQRAISEYTCPANECDYVTCNKKDFAIHIRQLHPGEYLLVCDFCGERFRAVKTFDKHLDTHTHERYSCEQCGRRFSKEISLQRHVPKCGQVIHCEECSAQFEDFESLKVHRKMHEMVTCSVCVKPFSNKYILDTHMARIHGQLREGVTRNLRHYYVRGQNRSEPCPICGKTYCNDSGLKLHMKEHAGEYTYQCEQCGKPFNHKASLKVHMEIHEGNAYPCSKCSSVYRTRVGLHTHNRTVHQPKRHTCEVCGRKFGTGEHLRAHRRTHTGEKPYDCEFCTQSFAQIATLQNHIRNIHDRRKPYKCDRCQEEFHRPGLLERHLQDTHGGVNSFQCVVCNEVFRSVRVLKNHLMERHVDQLSSESEEEEQQGMA